MLPHVGLDFQTFDLRPLAPACSGFKSFPFSCMFTAADLLLNRLALDGRDL